MEQSFGRSPTTTQGCCGSSQVSGDLKRGSLAFSWRPMGRTGTRYWLSTSCSCAHRVVGLCIKQSLQAYSKPGKTGKEAPPLVSRAVCVDLWSSNSNSALHTVRGSTDQPHFCCPLPWNRLFSWHTLRRSSRGKRGVRGHGA